MGMVGTTVIICGDAIQFGGNGSNWGDAMGIVGAVLVIPFGNIPICGNGISCFGDMSIVEVGGVIRGDCIWFMN